MTTLRIRGRERHLTETLIMGVVNASPESFSDGAAVATTEQQLALATRLICAGADIIDVGGQSSVTNQPELAADDELDRVLPVVTWLARHHPDVVVSVDTYKPSVAEESLRAGADIINDVSGLAYPDLLECCLRHDGALVIMHTAARPKQRLQRPDLYPDVVRAVVDFLAEKIAVATEAGLPLESIIVDPGPDFAKTPHQTLTILRNLDAVRALGRPLLLALSRKDFLGAILEKGPRGRDAGTIAAIAYLTAGASGHIVRVHDVAAARDAVRTVDALAGRSEISPRYVLADDLRYESPREADPPAQSRS